MLRLFRSRPNIFSLGTRVHGSHAPQPQTIRLQKVKLRRKWFKPMNWIVAGGIYYGCYQLYTISVFGTLGKWLDEQEAQLSEKDRRELDEEDDEPFFIPFPGFTEMVEPLPYRRTDPEWQAFVKVSRNQKLVKSIQNGLADLARRAVEAHPVLVQRCGKDAKVNKHWLDVQYPYKPPPTFVRKGLCIDDDGISIAEQPVDSDVHFRISRTLWPSPLTMALWSFSGALLKQNLLIAAKFIGYEPTPEPAANVQQTIQRIQQQLGKPPGKPNSQTPTSLPSGNTQAADGSSTDSTSSVDRRSGGPNTAPNPTSGSAPGVDSMPTVPKDEDGKPKSAKDMYMIKMAQQHTTGPWAAFRQKLAQTWRPVRGYPPRGSISVSGLVEINTSRAIVTIDVYAWWDPKTEKFDASTMVLRLRALRMKQQSPYR